MSVKQNSSGIVILGIAGILMAWNASFSIRNSSFNDYSYTHSQHDLKNRALASENKEVDTFLLSPNFEVSHSASKKWTQVELLNRTLELSKTHPQILVDVFRTYEERSDESNQLIKRTSVFPEVQIFSDRTEAHSRVQDPTPAEFAAVWVNNKLEFVFAVSTATYRKRFVPKRQAWENPETPAGEYDPIYMNRLHFSKTYKPADASIGPEMPYSIFIDDPKVPVLKSWSGYAFHGTTLSHYDALGTPDSGGCIRLSREDAEVLFSLVNPKLKTQYRIGRWYGDHDPRNKPNKDIVELRNRFKARVIDPEYLSKNKELKEEIEKRYKPLLGYLNVRVNASIQRSLKTLASGEYQTLREETLEPVRPENRLASEDED